MWARIRFLFLLTIAVTSADIAQAAVPAIPFTVTMSENVTVTGTPRIVLDVGGTTRYATYTSGTGTASLTFTYTATAGDVDLDGIGIASTTLDLNGGTLTDLNGNPETNLTFTAPANMGSVNVNYPSLSMDFVYDADGRYTLNGVVYNSFSSFLTAAGGTFSGGNGTYYNSSGILQTGTNGTPRFDYDPSTLQLKGILLEGYHANLALRSEEIGTSPWGTSNATVTANAVTAPDGTLSADKLVENASTGNKELYQSFSATTGATYTATIYAKAAERTEVRFNSIAGSSIFTLAGSGTAVAGGSNTASIQQINNGWYRLKISFPASASTETIYLTLINGGASNYTGDGSSGAYAWGAQIENLPTASSYVKTVSSTAAIGGETFDIPVASWFSNAEGTVASKTYTNSLMTSNYVFDLFTNTTNSVSTYTRESPLRLQFETITGAVGQANIFNSTTADDFETIVSSYKDNSFKLVKEGGTVNTDTAGTVPSITTLRTGSSRYGVSHLRGQISYIKYYPSQPTSTQLQLMSQ